MKKISSIFLSFQLEKLETSLTRFVVVVVVALVVVVEVPDLLPGGLEAQEHSRSWGVLPEDPGVKLRGFGWAVEEVLGGVGSLSAVGTDVVINFWVYSMKKGVETRAETRSQLG